MFLLRHGQSYFNLHFTETRVDPGIEDPELTPLGAEQAAAAARQLAGAALTRIIVSPYTRALQTAEPIRAVHRVPVDIMPEVRERAAFVCDIGSPPDLLAADSRITILRICRRAGGTRASKARMRRSRGRMPFGRGWRRATTAPPRCWSAIGPSFWR